MEGEDKRERKGFFAAYFEKKRGDRGAPLFETIVM